MFKVAKFDSKELDEIYAEAMKELDEFYELGWVRNTPRIFVVEDRGTINALFGKETEPWVIGWAEGRNVYILDNDAMERESSHEKKSPEEYRKLIVHEISHSFSRSMVGDIVRPKWLWEGVAIYTAKQDEGRPRPAEFKAFLDFFEEGGAGIYKESGFAVGLLIDKFGKQKLFELMKASSKVKDVTEFNSVFHGIYDFDPTYAEFNKLALGDAC